ncbi:MAG: hypothetical protein B7Y07_09040 [Halothiobacillus sp. 24-54-40]|jgi:uncharacterized membrane protein|nr:MAG: hypothetical protein B7Y58_08885 [Halothiobacillus sp. 35-54-62]OYZ86167.1 MAG: hypothetical protein B7Y07_09040 [Halothiobacillus sp. 24-54-40]OZA79652.1 MAG: hypothetical protein B7X64_09120 [Halothiobacillus sp. 39-53-45]HQS03692.1 hypothetical protein [Halothiobacillus sp.]HQS29384.1 hypothetical protein [Halothiobacillus sp.]
MIQRKLLSQIKDGVLLLLLGLDLLLANFLSPQTMLSPGLVALAFLPISLIALDVLMHQFGKKTALLATGGILGSAIIFLPLLQSHISVIYLVQHLTINVILGGWFAASLRPEREPVCTQLAGRLHPIMHPQLRQYTTQLTRVWAGFFWLMAALSLLLYCFSPIFVWSIFANTLTLPLVLLMFAGEYLVRLRVLPPQDHLGPLSAIHAYQKSLKARRCAASARS